MVDFIKKYKAFGIGFVILVPLILFLSHIEFIKIPEDSPVEVILVFSFWWIVISLPIYKIEYLKKKKKTVFKILGLIVLFFTALFVDSKIRMPDNPLTLFLLLVFWLTVIYIIIPTFFKKYLKPILVVYTLVMLYFTYSRLFSDDLETYMKTKKGMALSFFFLPIPLFFALWVFEQWKWLKTLKADKSKAELALLKTQINPHFFFNTLNNLYSLTVQHSEKAPEVILKLSEMMRYTIYEGEKELVTLQNEIEYLQNYIELHKIRYHKTVNLQFNHSVEEEKKVTPLLFINLLENAFKHGVESLRDKAYINIDLRTDEKGIYFSIENNFDNDGEKPEKGIGLENLKKRLRLTYPNLHELTISNNGSIFRVELNIMTK